MKRTIGRIACLVAATATIAACDPGAVTTPGTRPTAGAAVARTAVVIGGDTLTAPCPEVSIPELPCVPANPVGPGRDSQGQ